MPRLITFVFLILSFAATSLANQKTKQLHNSTSEFALQNSSSKVQLFGTVEDVSISSIQLEFYTNPISKDKETITISLSEKGAFSLSFDIRESIVATLIYNAKRIPLFLEPSDSLTIAIKSQQINYKGRGATHNDFLTGFTQSFGKYNEDYILYEAAVRSAMNFRNFIDGLHARKNLFWIEYNPIKKSRFSKCFQNYIAAEIDYWRAFHLMRYRIEHPIAAGIPSPMSLPTAYYDFLNELVLLNDEAIRCDYYLNFIEEYIDFRRTNPIELVQLNFDDTHLRVDVPMSMLLANADQMPVLEKLKKGTRLRFLGEQTKFESKSLIKGVMKSSPWYKVISPTGKTGWILGAGIVFERFTEKEAIKKDTLSLARSKIVIKAKTIFEKLDVFADPTKAQIVDQLISNEEADYLNIKTTEDYTYEKNGLKYKDIFYKIRTPKGKEGWVFKGGISLVEKEVTVTQSSNWTPVDILSQYSDIENYLSGKTYYYFLAKNIYWKSQINSIDAIQSELDDFINANPYQAYNEILQDIVTQQSNSDPYKTLNHLKIGLNITKLTQKEVTRSKTPIVLHNNNIPFSENVEITDNLTSSAQPILTPKGLAPKIAQGNYVEIEARSFARSKTETQLTGKINLTNSESVELMLYVESLLFEEESFTLKRRSNHTFRNSFKLSETTVGKIIIKDKNYPIYFEPGDQQNLVLNNSGTTHHFSFSGKGAANNNYLHAFSLQFETRHKELQRNIRYANPNAFRIFIDKIYQEKLSFLEAYQTREKLSKGFLAYAKADINYWYAFNLMNYPIEHPLYLEEETSFEIPSDWYSFFDEIPVCIDGALANKYYIYFLQEYLNYQKEQTENQGLNRLALAEKYFHGETLYYIKAKDYANACKRGSALEIGAEIKAFISECPYENFNDVLRYAYNEAKGLIIGTKAPDFQLTDINGKKVALSDFRNKVVYLDFWATWCFPCIRMLPHSQRLQKHFANEDVVFLYVSLDKEKSDWENYVKINNLTGIHLATSSEGIYQSQIAKLYRVKHLPAYFLIDKKGNVAQSPAKGPSSSQIIEQINSLLFSN